MDLESPTVTPSLCTVVANNYLPFARVLARSFRRHHPDGRLWVLLADRPDPAIDYAAEPFAVIFAADLGIAGFANLAFRYPVLELSTALKPYLFEHLHRQYGCTALCYLDPDVLVTGDLSPLFDDLTEHDALVTPHVLAPIDDDRWPGERDFLLSGVYNLGFFALAFNERTLPFLHWWQDRLYLHCEQRVESGLFVDQRWMDLAPALLERLKVLRDPGCNVAYWNLMHRRLEVAADGSYEVSGRPLRFFHFSGLAWDETDQISRYQDRYTLNDRPDLRGLFDDYRRRLSAAGIAEDAARPYGYDRFDNGVRVPPLARSLVQQTDPHGRRWPDPFRTGGPRDLLTWLLAPIPVAPGTVLPRLAMVTWHLRQGLQLAFPAPYGADAAAFAARFVAEAEADPRIDPRFVAAVRRPRVPSADAGDAPRDDAVLLARIVIGAHDPTLGMSRRQVRWLAGGAFGPGHQPLVPRLALHLWHQRGDLRSTFPDPLGEDRLAFSVWFCTYGRLEHRLGRSLVAPTVRRLPLRHRLRAVAWWWLRGRRRAGHWTQPVPAPATGIPGTEALEPIPTATSEPTPAVTIVGWADAATGVGEACRASLSALDAAGVDCGLRSLADPRLGPAGAARPTSTLAPIVLFHVNADMMGWAQQHLPMVQRDEVYRVGYWFWELAHFPLHLAHNFGLVDEVWAPSRFCFDAYRTVAPVPVRCVPPAVLPPTSSNLDRADLDLPPHPFLFLFVFDARSVPERKNPLGLLDAFELAVDRSDRPLHLLLKMSGAEQEPALASTLRRRAAGLPVTLLDRPLPRRELDGLFSACDAYVSLHRTEGLGLPLIEAMYLGKPVVATGYGGCTDFLDGTTAWPVRYRLLALDRDHGPYSAGTVWAEPDPQHAATAMLEVAQRSDEVARRVATARRRVVETYSPVAAGQRFRGELDRIEEHLDERIVPAERR